jgi:3-hydroxymyristoyl/3-hydroxydecanoyl-(acyl carrier protein) dehydratase
MLPYPLTLLSHGPDIIGTACFPADYPAFHGHFPGNPILPACLHIQAALDLLALVGRPSALAAIEDAKFLHPIKPDQLIHIFIKTHPHGYYHATLTVLDQTVSHFRIKVQALPA